jgi:hypothetical protein
LTYLSLFTDISIWDSCFGELIKTTYNVKSCFQLIYIKLSMIAYRLYQKQFDFILSCVIEIAYLHISCKISCLSKHGLCNTDTSNWRHVWTLVTTYNPFYFLELLLSSSVCVCVRASYLGVGKAIKKNRCRKKCQVEKQYRKDNRSMAAVNNSYFQSSISYK